MVNNLYVSYRKESKTDTALQVKFISKISDMGKNVKIIRIPKDDLNRIKPLGKRRVLVTLDDNVFGDEK